MPDHSLRSLPITYRGRCRTHCDPCSPVGSAGSSSRTGRLLFVLDADQDRADLVRQCLDVGHEHLVGELDGGIDGVDRLPGGRSSTIPLVDPTGMTGHVIDVRQANEFATGHVPGARQHRTRRRRRRQRSRRDR